MRMVGMRDSAYWSSWFLSHTLLLNGAAVLVLMAAGAAFQFEFFLRTNPAVLLLLFFLFALALSQLGLLLSVLIHRTKTAVVVGMLLFIVGLLLVLVLGLFGNLIFPALYTVTVSFSFLLSHSVLMCLCAAY